MDLRIGETHIFKYQNPPVSKGRQYTVGQLVSIFDTETQKLLGKYEVLKTNQFKILGRITNTYGHKRRKN